MKKAIKIIMGIVLAIVLLIILVSVLSRTYIHVGPYKSWEERGIGVLLPSLSDVLDKSEEEFYMEGHKGSSSFVMDVYGINYANYQKYVDAVMESGFTMEYYRSDDNFHAYHVAAFFKSKRLSLHWFKETNNPYRSLRMSVRLT